MQSEMAAFLLYLTIDKSSTNTLLYTKTKIMEQNKPIDYENIFDWASYQIKNEVHSHKYYKGPVEQHRYDYNLLCLEILAQAIKEYPNWTFRQIIANFGLLNGNLNEEPDATLGHLRRYKRQYEDIIARWDKLGLTDGLKGEVNETISRLYEYKP